MILVTGATGFIGSYLMCHLAEKNIFPIATFRHESNKNVVLERFKSKFPDAEERFKKIRWRKADFRNFPSLKDALVGITHIYHCAGYISLAQKDFKKLVEINQKGSAYLVDLCLEYAIEKLVYVSSIAALGNDPTIKIIDENTPWDNATDKTPYAYSKYGGELEVWRGIQEGLNAVIVNPGIVLGEGSPIEPLFNRYKNGLRWYTKGTNGYVGIMDVIHVMDQLMNAPIKAERFILVSENWSGKTIATQLLKAGNQKIKPKAIPKTLVYLVWSMEHLLQFLGIRKRVLSRAMISSQFEHKEIQGDKIKSFVDFEYSPIGPLLQ